MSESSRLRGNAPRRTGPYPLAEIPHAVAIALGRLIVHRLAVGHRNIDGEDFGRMFADAIDGHHRSRPLGIADVEWQDCAWSVKTVQSDNPFDQQSVRLISGRNNPGFSEGISDPLADVSATGRAVLGVWNARVNEAYAEYDDLRVLVMMRNMSTLQFTIFEYCAERYVPTEYKWSLNGRGNLVGFDSEGRHRFTWQPHGSQFTVLRQVPVSAHRFSINRQPRVIEAQDILDAVGYDDSWIEAFSGSRL